MSTMHEQFSNHVTAEAVCTFPRAAWRAWQYMKLA